MHVRKGVDACVAEIVYARVCDKRAASVASSYEMGRHK